MSKFKKQVTHETMPASFAEALSKAQEVADSLVDQVRKPTTELTETGEQYVIPGAERKCVKKGQTSLW